MSDDPYLRIALSLGETCISVALLADGAGEIDKTVNARKIFMGPFIETLSLNQPPENVRRIREYFMSFEYWGTPGVDRDELLPDEEKLRVALFSQAREELNSLFADGSQPASPEQITQFLLAMTRNDLRVLRSELVLRAAITNCASILESTVSSLVYEVLSSHPKLAITGIPEFHLGDILEYESLEEIIISVAESRAEELVRKGTSMWRKWFGDKVEDTLLVENVPWEDIQEVREIRNCVVHHNARISRQYARWARSRGKEVTVGTRLEINRATVAFCIATTYISSQLLIWGTVHRFSPGIYGLRGQVMRLSASDLVNLAQVSGITDTTIATVNDFLVKL